jgi:hypothetical protein
MSPFKPFKPSKTALLKGSFTIKRDERGSFVLLPEAGEIEEGG